MPATTAKPQKPSRTRIVFDLADELSAEEITAFEARAKEAGAKSLTEHFLNIALRVEPKPVSKKITGSRGLTDGPHLHRHETRTQTHPPHEKAETRL